jgi:hypothetical protein
MIGKNHFDLYPHPENEAIFRRVRDTGQAVFCKDKPFVFPDQPERGVTYWDWSLTPVKGAGGAAMGLVFSLRETTRYKLAQEASRAINRVFGTALACDTEEELARTCLETAEEITQSKFGFIGLLNAEGRIDAIAISDPGWKACRMGQNTGSRVIPKNFAIRGIYGRVFLDGKALFTNAHHVDEGIGKLDFLVSQDIFLNEMTRRYADVVLPASSFAEKDGTFTNTERRVNRVRAAVPCPGTARVDREIVIDLARALGAAWPEYPEVNIHLI